MKRPSKAGSNDSEKNLALIQQFNNLEKQWESLKESNHDKPRRSSTGSTSTLITSFNHSLIKSSPRTLMSSLQHRRSPSDGFLNVKNWDKVEILRERRAAITSGKVKGRRLFGAAEGSSEVELDLDYDYGGDGEILNSESDLNPRPEMVINGKRSEKFGEDSEIFNDWSDLNPRFNGKRSEECGEDDKWPDSSYLVEGVVVVEKAVVEVAEKRQDERKVRSGGGGRRCRVAIAWFGCLMVLLTLGLIVMSCNGNVHENEVLLVPT